MTSSTILLILLAVLISIGLSYFQYIFKNKNVQRITWILASIRFLAWLGVLLLLINPILSRKTFETIKTPLPIMVDNSSSVVNLNAKEAAINLHQKLTSNSALKDKFDVQTYRFDSSVETSATFDFKGKQTNIDEVAKHLKSVYRNMVFPTVIISDGNQTIGSDYVYGFENRNKVFPLILGDTTTFLDIKIGQLNVNKYVFHKNKFPVEVFLNYSGSKSISANFSISQGNNILNTQTVSFSPQKKSAILNVLLPANQIGLQIFKASISSKESEKNSYNNSKNFAVEVIDQKTNVAIITEINHPDVGALKRAIETNSQRKVTVVKPQEIKSLFDFNVLILYQPSSNFRSIFESNSQTGVNTLIITGPSTDYALLNQVQKSLIFKMSGQREDYSASFQSEFNLFAAEDIGFFQFPPLQNAFGTITTNSNVEVLLSSKIRNIDTNAPLLAFAENQGKRMAFLMGENSWKGRM